MNHYYNPNSALIQVALDIAATGLPVFPCGDRKLPCIPKVEGGHGHLDASTDPEEIRRLFSHRGARLVGVPTGPRSGFDVVEVDARNGGKEWEDANLHLLPETRLHRSKSGGHHYLLRHHPGMRNSAGKIAPGIDVRGDGGYVCYPPSGNYTVASDADIADWPSWLLPLALPAPKDYSRPPPSSNPAGGTVSDKRLEGFRRQCLDKVSRAAEGAKHYTLRDQARLLGGIQVEAGFSDAEAVQWLLDALPNTVEDWAGARRTAEWGLEQGRKLPIDLEDRPYNGKSNGAECSTGDAGTSDGTKASAAGGPTDGPVFYDPWSDPVPPEFPCGVLTSQMQATVHGIAQRDGVCPGALSMAYLAAVSGAASKSSRFVPYQNSTWRVPPVVWVMTIADSGQRKTAIEDTAFSAIRSVHSEVWAEHRLKLYAWMALSAKEKRETPKPDEPHSHIVEDVTPEKLQIILSNTDRGTFMARDEMAGLLDFGRYGTNSGAAERAFYLQAYEGGHYTVSRVTRDSIHITVNGLTIYGSIQPDRLKDFPDLAKDGILQRINTIRASISATSRDEIIVEGGDVIDNKIAALIKMDALIYRTTPEGSALIHETELFGHSLCTVPDFGQGFQGTASKLHGTHARYALLLHLLNDPLNPIIPADTVQRAQTLINRFLLPQAHAFYANLTGSPQQKLRDVAGWVLVKSKPRFLASDVTAGVRSCRGMPTKELADLLDPLITGGWLKPETHFPNNRAWFVHRGLAPAFAERTETERQRREEVREARDRIWSRPVETDQSRGQEGVS